MRSLTRSKIGARRSVVGIGLSVLFTDDFNRSDRNLNGDNGWGGSVSFGSVNIVSGQASSTNADNGIWLGNLSGGVSNTDHYCDVDVVSLSVGSLGGVMARFTDSANFYNFIYDNFSATKQWMLQKRVANTYTTLGTTVESRPALPFRMRLEIKGTHIVGSVLQAGIWVVKATANDASLAGGKPGMFFQHVTTEPVFDNYAHGNT